MKKAILITILHFLLLSSCQGQNNNSKIEINMSKSNPLLCDPETGLCEIGTSDTETNITAEQQSKDKNIKIIYFTDPICSACWGIEGALRKLKLEYGHEFSIEYHMGGLLPSFGNGYNAGGITGPKDVAVHWDEASDYYQMPIDGNVWLEDPLSSSYPSSIAFKAATLQNEEKAIDFLRRMREMLFLQKKNISKWEVIEKAAKDGNLDIPQLKTDYEGQGKQLFEKDLMFGRQIGVRGFPTLLFVGNNGTQQVVYGSKPYSAFEEAIRGMGYEVEKNDYNKDILSIIGIFKSLTIKELSVLGEISMEKAKLELESLEKVGKLTVTKSRKGDLWRLIE